MKVHTNCLNIKTVRSFDKLSPGLTPIILFLPLFEEDFEGGTLSAPWFSELPEDIQMRLTTAALSLSVKTASVEEPIVRFFMDGSPDHEIGVLLSWGRPLLEKEVARRKQEAPDDPALKAFESLSPAAQAHMLRKREYWIDSIYFIALGSRTGLSTNLYKSQLTKTIRTFTHANANKPAPIMVWVDSLATLEHAVEALHVVQYRFNAFKKDPADTAFATTLIYPSPREEAQLVQESLHRSTTIGQSINHAQDLINYPSNHCTPTQLAHYVQELNKGTGLDTTVHNAEELKQLHMNCLRAVAQGSEEEAKCIVIRHKGGSKAKLALVGKGVTFDSGGISIKPSHKMDEMKTDMSGGAIVIAVLHAIATLGIPIDVLGIIPATENMPSGRALKPGDVITAMNGTNIEVLDTDAEGRLILADALCYAVKEQATHIIDLATLTGACVVALGTVATGLMTNHQAFANDFMTICAQSGEKVWQLPLFHEYREQIKSDIADIKNIGGREAGTITAACFLEHFVQQTPWIHLDIAGTNWAEKDHYYNKGATGVLVSSCIRYAQHLAERS